MSSRIEPVQFEHASGLTIIHHYVTSAPVVAFQYWVQVGSADERSDQAGLAHVHEHMLFKGTERRGPGQIAADIETLGGTINAWTSFDQTVYHAIVPSRFAADGLDVLTDAVTHSVFDAAELERELEVIQEEIRRGMDSPVRMLFQRVYDRVWTAHPYGKPIIGTPASVASFTRDHVTEFYERWYHPANMTLVVVGDLPRTELEALLDRHFEQPDSEFVARPGRTAEPPQVATRVTAEAHDVQAATLALTFRAPELHHDDTPALELLTMLMGAGESSLLFERIQRQQQLVDGISASLQTGSDPGLLIISASFQPQNGIAPEAVITAVLREVAQLHLSPPPRRDLDRVRTAAESSIHFGNETVGGIARRLGYYHTVAGNWAYHQTATEALRAVTPRDVQRVAQQWLRPETLTIGLTVPRSDDFAVPTEPALVAAASGAFQSASDAASSSAGLVPDAHGIIRTRLESGLTLLIQPDSTVETFAIDAIALGGSLTESDSTAGATAMVSELLTSGTPSRTASELSRQLDELAASMWSSAGRHSMRLSMTGLARDFDASVELFADSLFQSQFPDDEVERVRRETLNQIRRQRDDLAQSAFRLFARTLWGEHPLARAHVGTAETVGAITRPQLLDHYAAIVQPSRLVVTVVGNVEPELVVRTITAAFPENAEPTAVVRAFSTPPSAPAGPLSALELRERQQAHIVVGWPTVDMSDERRLAFGLLAAALNGQGGRLFMDLRDAQSLAYSVSATSTSGPLGGYFAIYIATSPAKIDQALAGIHHQIELLQQAPLSDDELTRARRSILGRQDIFMQRPSSRSVVFGSDEIMGFGYDHIFRSEAELDAITAEQLHALAQEFFVDGREVVSIVRPPIESDAPTE